MTLGDFDASSVIYFKFTTTRPSTGAPYTLGGTPAISVYKDNSTTQTTTGVTLTADFDSVTGLNHVAIDTSTDGTFYAAGSFFDVVITTGTVDSVSAVGTVVGRFTIRKTSALKPTTAGRTLDVSAGGEAGLDWANIGSATATVNLSATTVKTLTDAPSDPSGVTTLLTRVSATRAGYFDNLSGGAVALASGVTLSASQSSITFAQITATKGITADITGNLSGSVASVEGDVARVTGNVLGNVVGSVGSVTSTVNADVIKISGDSVAADNAEAFFDGTGYAGTNNVIPTVTTVTNAITLPTAPTDWITAAALAADAVTEIQFLDTEIAAIKAKTDLIPAAPAAVGDIPTAAQNADKLLGRAIAGSADGGRTVSQALMRLRNRNYISGGTLYITTADDTTVSWSAALTTGGTAAEVTDMDPA